MNQLQEVPHVPGALSWELRNELGAVAVTVELSRAFVGVCVCEQRLTALITLDAGELDALLLALNEAREALRSDLI